MNHCSLPPCLAAVVCSFMVYFPHAAVSIRVFASPAVSGCLQKNWIWHTMRVCVRHMCGQDSENSSTLTHRRADRSNRLVQHFVTVWALLNPVPFVCEYVSLCVCERHGARKHVMFTLILLGQVLSKHLLIFQPISDANRSTIKFSNVSKNNVMMKVHWLNYTGLSPLFTWVIMTKFEKKKDVFKRQIYSRVQRAVTK